MPQIARPFHEKEYKYDKKRNCYFPILEISVGNGKTRKKIPALADTGCTPDIYLCQAYIEKENIILGKKMNIRPEKVSVADGHKINANLYKAICEINGEQREVEVCVVDPEKFFDEEEPKIELITPLLGRGVMDAYNVMFKGKKRRLLLFHPEKNTSHDK